MFGTRSVRVGREIMVLCWMTGELRKEKEKSRHGCTWKRSFEYLGCGLCSTVTSWRRLLRVFVLVVPGFCWAFPSL